MSKEVNQHQRAAKAWEVLIKVAEKKDFVRYKGLGDKIGIHHRAIRFVLAVIQEYCLENKLPPLTILIGDESGMPGKGFIAWDRDNIKEGKREVYNYNWSQFTNPFNYALTEENEQDLINTLLEKPEKSNTVFQKVKVRGTAQIIFRKALLKAYKSKCAICGISYKIILQAAHIIPWSKSNNNQKMDICNGLLLCANHHGLFDKGYIKISDNYKIMINPKLKQSSSHDETLTGSFNNQKIILPKNKLWWPNLDYLENHRRVNPSKS
ncbi:HNH endonuclease [Flavivirga abyssicola]|uniref:HNH endonuclease n=1 Tax=Flavivirga abyssicola TaxID=3063533 RepID=UPI0026DFE38A|nr:HNH endonuclease [Flavivirga sp. MEBiC07777]WVK13826.1 HNH endonuclease [Flavivirga sp. MEBiC07777]